MTVDLRLALEHHRRGRIDLATAAYEAALLEDPANHEAQYLLGIVAFQSGDLHRAVELMERAIATRGDIAEYHASLAEVHWALGDLDRAVTSFRESLRIQPNNAAIHNNLGATLVDKGFAHLAIDHFREALRLEPDFEAAHNNLAKALLNQGDIQLAAAHFRRVVQVNPASADAHNQLGKILLQRGELPKALAHGLEAVRLRPNSYDAQLNLGNIFHLLGRLDEAEACFREAIRIQPNLAMAHASLGGLLEDRGDPESGIASLREALRFDPGHSGALARLASRQREKLDAANLERVESLLASSTLASADRQAVLFGLTQVEDARGRFARAAELAAEANALQLAELQAQGRSYSPASYQLFVDRLLEAFSAEFLGRIRGWGLNSERPVFVVGMPRSGTSLVEQILASHPRVHGAGEIDLVRRTFEAIPEATGKSATISDAIAQLQPDSLRRLASQFLERLAELNSVADRVVDKMPENTLYLGLIAALFPQAKVIHCRRDLRDVALSCWLTSFGRVRWASDLDHIAHRIAQYKRVMAHWRRVDPIPILDVDYEAAVADLPGIARTIISWIGMEWDPACLDFHKTTRPVLSASTAQVRQPIYTGSVGRWKNYEQTLGPFFARLE